MNRGILQLAFSGTVELELNYREPDGKELDVSQLSLRHEQLLNRNQQQFQIDEEFACLLQAI